MLPRTQQSLLRSSADGLDPGERTSLALATAAGAPNHTVMNQVALTAPFAAAVPVSSAPPPQPPQPQAPIQTRPPATRSSGGKFATFTTPASESSQCRTVMAELISKAERLWDIAEHDIAAAQSALSRASKNTGDVKEGRSDDKEPSFQDRLIALHIEEARKEQWSSHLNPCSNLLSLLCRSQPQLLNRLILTLHPGNRGYTCHLGLTAKAAKKCELPANGAQGLVEAELLKLPYEDDYLLDYIDAQELPPTLLDLLDGLNVDLFYSGCLVVEVRDFRRKTGEAAGKLNSCEVQHVLLRPTTQSVICDSNLLAEKSARPLSAEERTTLEGRLAQLSSDPLCLDPDPVVAVLARKADVARKKLNAAPTQRMMRKFSAAGVNRKRKLLEQCAAPPEVRLLDFVSTLNQKKKKSKKLTAPEVLVQHQNLVRQTVRAQQAGQFTDASRIPPLAEPSGTTVSEHARAILKRQETNDMSPHLVEEYVLETSERSSQRIYHTRLTIYQRQANEEFLGELYVERDYRENENKGSTCRFILGTRPNALRYINQFTEIFTEEGRKSVKITHRVPNQPPRVTMTPGMRERQQNASERAAAAASRMQAAAAAGQTAASAATATAVNGVANVAPSPQPQPAVLQKKVLSTPQSVAAVAASPASILQQQLSAPPIPGPSAQTPAPPPPLPLHPLPPNQTAGLQVNKPQQVGVVRAASQPGVRQTLQRLQCVQPTNILQNQLTIQTAPGAAQMGATASAGLPQGAQQQVQLPLTPHPMTPNAPASANAQPSPAPATPATPATPLQQPHTPHTPQQPSPALSAGPQAIGGQSLQQQQQQPTPDASSAVAQSSSSNEQSQEKAISAIMQSLMQDSAQFEANNGPSLPEMTPPQAPPTPKALTSPSPSASGSLVGGAQLPTCPVPPASLAEVVVSVSKHSGGSPVVTNPKLLANRVSLQNLLSAQVIQQGPQQQNPPASPNNPTQLASTAQGTVMVSKGNVIVSNGTPMPSQLAAQLSRPVGTAGGFPPPYTQAVAQAQRPRLILTTAGQQQQQQLVRRQSVNGGQQQQQQELVSSPQKSLSQDAPGLQALLANAPSADNPNPSNSSGVNQASGMTTAAGSSSLLERLVSRGQVQGGPTSSLSAAATASPQQQAQLGLSRSLPVSSALTPITNNNGGGGNNAIADSTQEITLAAILAKPPASVANSVQQRPPSASPSPSPRPMTPSSAASPSKASPLLQQLQQPVQQAPTRQILQAASQAVAQQQQASPLRQLQPPMSPAKQQQQRMAQPSPSPTRSFSLPSPRGQQQLMQPPIVQQQRNLSQQQQQSILSATLQQSPQQQILQQGQQGQVSMVTVPVQELVSAGQQQQGQLTNGLTVNSANGPITAQQHQQQPHQQNVVSLQNLLQSGVVQVSAGNVTASNQSGNNMVQLSIPGLQAPVTLSVNLPTASIAVNDAGQVQQQQAQQQGIIITSQPNFIAQQKGGSVVTSMGKFVQQQQPQAVTTVNTSGGQQVLLQQTSAGNSSFIQLPQQPSSTVKTAQNNILKSAMAAHKQQQQQQGQQQAQFVQVRQAGGQSQVLLQVPQGQAHAMGAPVQGGGQPIQIVRAMQQQQPQVIRTLQQPAQGQQQQQLVQIGNAIKSPPPNMMGGAATPSPQSQGVMCGIPPSPSGSSSITSPQSGIMMPPDSPLVAIQMGGNTAGGVPLSPGGNELILAPSPGVPGGQNKTGVTSQQQNQMKMRAQRKQSLK